MLFIVFLIIKILFILQYKWIYKYIFLIFIPLKSYAGNNIFFFLNG